MLSHFYIAVVFLAIGKLEAVTDVSNLVGEPEFRSAVLQWQFPIADSSGLVGFVITYCEDRAWGRYRCKNKEVKLTSKSANISNKYETTLDKLRMATNYTIEVSPIYVAGSDRVRSRARAIGSHISLKTKGFSAKAIQCLANSSLIEIETGPNFGGKISVEGTIKERCITQGDYANPKNTYFLKIDHRLCGSAMFNTSVRTYVIVQESLSLLTHSTRRFMVICTYVPETFTVRAGVKVPEEEEESENELVPTDQDVVEVDPVEFFDAEGNFFSSRLTNKAGRALKFSADTEKEPQKWSHLVLMVVMVIAAAFGMIIAVWQFIQRSRRSNRTGFMTPQSASSTISMDENTEAIIRDFEDSSDGDSSRGRFSQSPPVALVSVKEAIMIDES